MAVVVLLLPRGLRESAAKLGREEDRVVSKAVFSARFEGEQAIHETGHDGQRAACPRESDHTDEARSPLAALFSGHLAEQLLNPVRVGCAGPSIARGVDPGRSAQRRDYESGVIGDNEFRGKLAVVQGFSGAIFSERGG